MSTGGTVPRQGTTAEALSPARQQQLEQDKKQRGPMGELGDGTPGSRLKSQWRKSKSNVALREFARGLCKVKTAGWEDAAAWLSSKLARNLPKRVRKPRLNFKLETKAEIKVPKKEKAR